MTSGGVVFFTRTEVTVVTLCDSFAILDVSELRILHACRRVGMLDIFLLTLGANSGVEHGDGSAAKVRSHQDPFGDMKPLLLIMVDIFVMGPVAEKDMIDIVDAADTTLPRQPSKLVPFCEQLHILTN